MSGNEQHGSQSTIEDCKEYIRQLYLVQRKTQKQILGNLVATKQLHLTKSQLEYKLRKWNFRRELNQNQWWYVKRKIEYRQRQNKDSEVVLSGVPIDQKTVERETARLFLSTIDRIKGITERSKTPENMDLSVCTPGTSDMEHEALNALRNLPWARLHGLQVARLLYQTCHQSMEQHGELPIIWLLVSQILARLTGSLHDAGKCHLMGRTIIATQSIDRYAFRLGSIIPQGPSQQHFKMLSNLRNQSSSNTQLDALRLLIFSVSNNFVMARRHGPWYNYFSTYMPEDDAQEVLQLFQATAMDDLSIISRLHEATSTVPTISIFVKSLLDAAILLRCHDVAAAILQAIHKDSPWTYMPRDLVWMTDHTPLAMAVRHGNECLTRSLLEAGADPNALPDCVGPTPLENAAAIDSHDTAFKIASFLVSHGADLDPDRSICSRSTIPLSFAVMRGDFRLIELLVGLGADFGQVSRFLVYPDSAYKSLGPRSEVVDETSPEIFAADFCSTEGPRTHNIQKQLKSRLEMGSQAQFMTDQKTACQMVEYMLGQKVLPNTSSLCPENSRIRGHINPNDMIVAAYRGYRDVISILHNAGASVTALNSIGVSPLSAAALRGNVGTCRLLMELDSSHEDPKEFDHDNSSCRFPTALQIAAWFDNVEICQEVLAHGTDPNGPHASSVGDSGCHHLTGPETDQYALQYYATRFGWNCLRMSLLRRSAKVARCLLEHHHVHAPKKPDLLLAASLGDVEIMARMLKTMKSPGNKGMVSPRSIPSCALGPQRWTHFRLGKDPKSLIYSEDCQGVDLDRLTPLQVAAFEGNTNIVKLLLESGFQIVGAEAACAFRSGPKSLIQIILDRAPESLHQKTLGGRSYLEMAFLGGHRYLVEFALDLDTGYYDSGALCAAVVMGFEAQTVQNLLRRRSCFRTEKTEQEILLFNTALSLAAFMRRRDLVQELLAVRGKVDWHRCIAPDRPAKDVYAFGKEYKLGNIHEAEVDKRWIGWHASNFRSFSPIFLAVLGQDEDIVQDILNAGYSTDGLTLKAAVHQDFSMSLNEKLINACLSLEDGGGESYTPLQEAIVHGKTDWVRLLLRARADPRARRRHAGPFPESCVDRTAFQLAVEANIQEITDMLLDSGVCVNEPAGTVNGMTALQIAAHNGLLGVAIRLRGLGADMNAHRALEGGQTALESAAGHGRLDLVHYLLDSGVLTTGKGRVQYLVAIKRAEYHAYYEISKLLRGYRSWTEEDFDLFHKLEIPYPNRCFYHPDEYSDDEREEILKETQLLEARREAGRNRIEESEAITLSDDEGEDFGSIGDEATSHSARQLGLERAVSEAIIPSYASNDEAEIDWAKGFEEDFQLPGDSKAEINPQLAQHMSSEEAEVAWGTGLDIPQTDVFDFPLFAQEEWPFAFEGFEFPEEQF